MTDESNIPMRKVLGETTGAAAPKGFADSQVIVIMSGAEWTVLMSALCGFKLSEEGGRVYVGAVREMARQISDASKRPAPKHSDAFEEYRTKCFEDGEMPCIDTAHHKWVVSDENENDCYCEKCGAKEY